MKSLIVIVLLSFSSVGIAGSATGKVTGILISSQASAPVGTPAEGFAFFTVENTVNQPACSATGGKAWAVRLDREWGRAMLANMMSAKAQDKNVTVTGRGNCDQWPDRETPQFIQFND